MKAWLMGVLVFAASTAFAQVPVIPYDGDIDFLKLPKDLHLGEVTGVAVNSKKHIFVFSRGSTTGPAYAAAAAQLLEFGPDGQFIREIGKNLYAWSFAHVVRIDKDDNIWAVDKGSDMIIKFSPEGRVVMVFGRSSRPGLPCLRAAVGPYLFQTSLIGDLFAPFPPFRKYRDIA